MELKLKLCLLIQFLKYASGVCTHDAHTTCLDDSNNQIITSCYFVKERTFLNYSVNTNDKDVSEYDFEFIAFENDCKFDSYELTVELVSNVYKETDCKFNNSVSYDKSIQRIHITNPPQCNQLKVNFCLLYWFSGCYSLTFAPHSGSNSHRPVTYYEWLVNNHTLEDFVIRPPVFVPLNQEPFELVWTFKPNTLPSDNESFLVHLEEYDSREQISFNPIDITENCTLSNQKISCEYRNLTEGNYSIHLSLRDEWRCSLQDGLFGDCMWTSFIERFKPPDMSEYKFTGESTFTYFNWIILVGLILFLTFIVSVMYCFIMQRKPDSDWNSSAEEMQIHSKHEKNKDIRKIFLLYARDCQPFMDTMVELRHYLVTQSGCKVYDIYDNMQFNEIAKSPFEFVEALLQDETIFVVVIATKCAEILYQASLKYMSTGVPSAEEISHQNPNPLDRLTLHAMKLISYNTTATSYKKFFVVRLPVLNDTNDYLMHINPGIRYDLPNGLETLMDNMWFRLQEKELLVNSIVNKEGLLRALYNLNEYVQNNPHYLKNEILNECLYM